MNNASSRAATLLKYRFGDTAQMNNHLHVVDARTLFFFRDQRIPLEAGARVVIELSIANSEQVATLRGSVLARAESGAWIEFPDSRLAKRLDAGQPIVSRGQKRLGCDLMIEMKFGVLPLLGRMVDVSMAGARVTGTQGLRPGAEVLVRIMGAQPPMPGEIGRAEVARTDSGGDLGLRFVKTDTPTRIASGKLFAAVQQAWSASPELSHSPLCCVGGHVLEPPIPHTRNSRQI